MSTIHKATEASHTLWRVKEDGKFSCRIVRQPNAFQDYDRFMKGVNRSDQLNDKYDTLRKKKNGGKHYFTIGWTAVVNSYVIHAISTEIPK